MPAFDMLNTGSWLQVQRSPLATALLIGMLFVVSCAGEKSSEEDVVSVKELPPPNTTGTFPLEQAIAQRRSVRAYVDEPLSADHISQLLWSAQGITEPRRGFRAAPSAGATYPLETYLVTAEAIFRYIPEKHALEERKRGDYRPQLAEAALGQGFVRQAPATILFTALPERTTERYGDRGTMYVHMEAGHAAQNLHLQAVALGLGSVPVGAFSEDKVERILACGKNERALYMIPVGRPR